MSATVSPITIAAVLQNDYDTLSASIGLISILLLLLLLVGKEVVRARGASGQVVGAFDVPIIPLVCSTSVILSLRLLDLLV